MAYGDKWDFIPDHIEYQTYTDGTVVPHLEVQVLRNGEDYGYVEIHMHRTKYSPHDSVGFTSRVGRVLDG